MKSKPRTKLGYSAEITEVVRSACLSVAVTLGDYLDDVVVVGGLVPSLLAEGNFLRVGQEIDRHVGTMDLDLGLSLSVLNQERYMVISERLRAEGFAPDVNEEGNTTRQRWQRDGLTIDFLIPAQEGESGGGLQSFEASFAALVTVGLGLAFDERVEVAIEGVTLDGESVRRPLGVCGPGAFVALKALAFHNRSEPKDAYDLVHVLRFVHGGVGQVAEELHRHSRVHESTVATAIQALEEDFETVGHLGPRRAAEFMAVDLQFLDDVAADAHGFVDDLLRSYREISAGRT